MEIPQSNLLLLRALLLLGWSALEPDWLVCLWGPLAAIDAISEWYDLLRLARAGAKNME